MGKTSDVGPALSAFLDNKTLSADKQNEINRLLGIYTRVKYGKAATETLRELVEIPTFNVDGLPQYKKPEFIKIAGKIQDLAKAFNLNFRNIDNRVYEISLKGSGDDVVSIHAHADVVPVTPENWMLEDGTQLDPFKVTLIGDRMYGRGTGGLFRRAASTYPRKNHRQVPWDGTAGFPAPRPFRSVRSPEQRGPCTRTTRGGNP